MRPSTRCSQSLRSGSEEMTRKYSVIWEIRKLNRKCTQDFVVSVGYTNDCFRNTSNNGRMRTNYMICCQSGEYFCSDTCCIVSCRARIIQCVAQSETDLRNNIWGIDQLVSNIMLINIARNTPKQEWLTWIVLLMFSAVAMTALDRYVFLTLFTWQIQIQETISLWIEM